MRLVFYEIFQNVENTRILGYLFRGSLKHPDIRLTSYEYGSARAATLVEEEELDVALVNLQLDHPDLVGIPLDPPIEQKVGLIWRKSAYISRSVQTFLDFVKDYPLFPED